MNINSVVHNINVMLEILGCMMCLIMYLFLRVGRPELSKRERLFGRMLLINVGVLSLDTLTYLLDSQMGFLQVVLNHVGVFGSFLLSYCLIVMFTMFMKAYVGERTRVAPEPLLAVRILMTVACLLLVITEFFYPIYYYYGIFNDWHAAPLFFISPVLCIVSLIICAAAAIHYRSVLSSREVIAFVIYTFLPAIAAFMQTLIPGSYEFVNISVPVALIIIYLVLQIEEGQRSAERDRQLAEMQTAIMMSQIQPHFLYNALEAIGDLCHSDPKAAEQATTDFSLFLRGNMDSLSSTAPIPFEKELDHTRTYLSLEKLRFDDRLNVVYDIRFSDFGIPALTLQPIVENAVRYGLMQREDGGKLWISSRREGDKAIVTVRDDGTGFDPNEKKYDGRSHIGIENVRRRLEEICGGSLVIESFVGVGTTAVITLPLNDEGTIGGASQVDDSDDGRVECAPSEMFEPLNDDVFESAPDEALAEAERIGEQ